MRPTGRIPPGMSPASFDITPTRFDHIIDHYADADLPGTPAYRLAALLRDPIEASDLVRDWIGEQARRIVMKGRTLTPGLLAAIGERTSIEALAGVPVDQMRAGSKYERLRGRRGAWHVSRGERAALWDEAVCMELERQYRAGVDKPRNLPLADGTRVLTHAKADPERYGLDAWERLHARRRNLPLHRWDMDGGEYDSPVLRDGDDTTATAALAEPFHVTRAWLDAHHVTVDQVAALGVERLEAMGVSVRSVRDMRPLTRVERQLDLILHDPDLARRLADMHPGASAADMLALEGMPVVTARTGILYETAVDGLTDDAVRLAVWDNLCRATGATPGYKGRLDYLRDVNRLVDRLHAHSHHSILEPVKAGDHVA